ncbi:MAG: leucine-rich repeat protein [Muribaculaceae bacterium]|nr:leucine-rich repeat protein [Muribaculaceae bacterium]
MSNSFFSKIIVYQGLRYSTNRDGASVTLIGHIDQNAKGNLIIPDTIKEFDKIYRVTEIGANAFNGCTGLTGSLLIPNSVTVISENAFNGCTGLTGSLIIPHGISIIEESVFMNCTGLNGSINLPDSVTVIRESAFSGCINLKGQLILPNSIVYIDNCAFHNCPGLIGPLNLPQSVLYVGDCAFDDSLIDAKTKEQLKNISTEVLEEDNQCFWVDEFGVRFSQNRKRLLKAPHDLNIYYSIPPGTEIISDYAFQNCHNLTRIEIPNTVTSIGDGAFSCCYSLAWANIPNSVKRLGKQAFYDCQDLKIISLSESLKIIERSTFDDTNITEIIIPPSVIFIDKYVLNLGNTGYNITLLNPSVKITSKAFDFGDLLMTGEECRFSLPKGTMESFLRLNGFICNGLEEDEDIITDNDFVDTWIDENNVIYSSDRKRLLKAPATLISYTIPQHTEIICREAFAGCKIKEIFIPDSVKSINERAFCQCEQLINIIIPDSVIHIGRAAFRECKSLSTIVMPNAITFIEKWMFYDCKSLTKIKFPMNLKGIDDGAFYGCLALKNFILPHSVSFLGEYVFAYCESIIKIIIPEPKNWWFSIRTAAFYKCKNLKEAILPMNLRMGYTLDEPHPSVDLFYKCESLKHIFIPSESAQELSGIIDWECQKFITEVTSRKMKKLRGKNP